MKCWDDFDPDNPAHEDYLNHTVLPAMLAELRKQVSVGNLAINYRLDLALKRMENAHNQNPFHLIRVIKQCLQEESNIVRQYESVSRTATKQLIAHNVYSIPGNAVC